MSAVPSVESVVIAGAGQAGGRAAEALRAAGFCGAMTSAVWTDVFKDMAMFRRLAGKPVKLDRAFLKSTAFGLRKALTLD